MGFDVPPLLPPHSVLAVKVLVFPTIEILPVVEVIQALEPERLLVEVPGIVFTVAVYALNFPLTLKVNVAKANLV